MTEKPSSQFLDLVHPLAVIINERTAQHFGVLNGAGMDLRCRDIRIHDLEMPLGQVSGASRGRNQMCPCIPLVDKRLEQGIAAEIYEVGAHFYWFDLCRACNAPAARNFGHADAHYVSKSFAMNCASFELKGNDCFGSDLRDGLPPFRTPTPLLTLSDLRKALTASN